jgi:hypothetical protein
MAERGHRVFMFDHTIDALPADHERFAWIRQGLGSAPNSNPELARLRITWPGLNSDRKTRS